MKAVTQRARFKFIVKEYGDGTPWITLEALSETISCLRHGFMGFDLRRGTDLSEANEIAQALNEQIVGVSFTELK